MSGCVIPNIYNKLLCYCALLHAFLWGVGGVRDVVISVVMLIGLFLVRAGMGDIKTIGLILMTHTSGAIALLAFIFLVATLHILVDLGFHRRLPSKIPLAPSIFLGLATYLATS